MTSQRNVGSTAAETTKLQSEGADVVSRVVEAVAEREGMEPTAVEPRLYEVIDPDALSALVEDPPESGLTVGFDYAGYRVVVVADEGLHVEATAEA
ncbi:hypothetical protein B4589_016410 (plasmid) [Halolamina sp. CBA1230]|uniref:HalOD1 output domain-containing protein n=1 Tax=Halolamina sp. CBA1230 TaxID=1853690 RepID=UPI0009A176FB|nr:HalOD1 output domain-containing protein [Halolamina sp. CBA1230]QKY21994.1 hypothetical protein B4589_016410 [Halolamina sp. CBA1230]